MQMKHKNALWDTYQTLNDLIAFKDTYLRYAEISKQLDLNELEEALSAATFLVYSSKELTPNHIGDLKKPNDFSQLIIYIDYRLKEIKRIKRDLHLYNKETRYALTRKVTLLETGLQYYIDKLEDKTFIERLPDKIKCFNSKYN